MLRHCRQRRFREMRRHDVYYYAADGCRQHASQRLPRASAASDADVLPALLRATLEAML